MIGRQDCFCHGRASLSVGKSSKKLFAFGWVPPRRGYFANKLALTNEIVGANVLAMIEAVPIDAVMRALADPTRRAVFERIVTSGEITVVELTRGSGVTQGAISQHLKSLKQAGLISDRAHGRNVFYRAEPQGLAPLFDWMSHYAVF